MTDLVEWLRAALDEHERIARKATAGPWRLARYATSWCVDGDVRPADHAWVAEMKFGEERGDAEHIATNDPAHALRTVQAHREILERCAEKNLDLEIGEVISPEQLLAQHELLSLASIYRESFPGFDPSWIGES